jgi:hypothetical protein
VAKEAQNPLANVISLPLQNNTDFGIGTYDKSANTLNIQPIIPVSLGKSKKVQGMWRKDRPVSRKSACRRFQAP